MSVLTTSSLPQTGQKLTFSDAPFDIDKHVTEKKCLLFNKLLPGDLVLALMCTKVKITCIHMRTQPAGCKICGGIAHLRVHVEREIGCVC